MIDRIARFSKVSESQFIDSSRDHFIYAIDALNAYRALKLPQRATSGSAGYDFFSPVSFELEPGKTIRFPTGIRCEIERGWFLAMLPRSSTGMKYKIVLDNTCGIIDSDYFHAKNEGHIMIQMTNNSRRSFVDKALGVSKNTWVIHEGDRICQAIFMPYGITYDDNVRTVRTGGEGSTGI